MIPPLRRSSAIEKLFDSLMQGYPFGAFLFWKVGAETSDRFKFFDFVLNYHQRDAKHCPERGPIRQQSVTAVLDGQQRLTALNIGLRGSMAIKQPNKWWNNPDAFPVRHLYLDMMSGVTPGEDGLLYRFRFLDADQAAAAEDGAAWFKVADIFGFKEAGPEILEFLLSKGLQSERLTLANRALFKLFEVIRTKPCINYYEEETKDLERVLNIFIRLNNGGMVLSHSDLLLSIAVAQWKQVDARKEIHKLVDELNRIGTGFTFSQDFVLKAGLMLADIASVGFKVGNFTATNMTTLEASWAGIRQALLRTVELAASFGLNGQTLRADSALLPIAYYLRRRSAPPKFVLGREFAADRAAVREWLIRSLLKASGIWGSGLDTLLTLLRDVIREHGANAFPTAELNEAMTRRARTLAFDPAEIEDLLHLEYGNPRTLPLLTLLYPFVDLRNQFHVDHIFPISRFRRSTLRKAGFDEDAADQLERQANGLPNLHLLEGLVNTEKLTSIPSPWLMATFPDETARQHYCEKHDLGVLPADIQGFEAFYTARRDRLRERLVPLLAPTVVHGQPEADGAGRAEGVVRAGVETAGGLSLD
jgi:hypothetical protein